MSATRSTARARRPSKAYLRSKGLPTDSENSGDDDQAQPLQSDSVFVPAVVQASVSSASTPTTTVVSTPTSTPPVISSETHDSRNRRVAFDKRYNTSEMTDDEVLGKNLLSMVNTLLTNL